MQRERDVADRMREIEANLGAAACGRSRECRYVERLAAQVLDARQQHEGDALALLGQQRLESLPVEMPRARRGIDLEQRVLRLETVQAQMRDHGVAIGRERVTLDDDLVAFPRRPEEAHEHQMQIHGERVHGHDFVGLGAYEGGQRGGETLVIVEPARTAGAARAAIRNVALDAESRPAIELTNDRAARRTRHGTERVSAEVGQGAARVFRQLELAPEALQLVGRIERARVLERGAGRAGTAHHFGGATAPHLLHVRAAVSA